MENITEFTALCSWLFEVKSRGLDIKIREGSSEDPYTHYSAYISHTDRQIGYFGDANGSDSDHGVIAKNEVQLSIWMGY